MKTRPREVRWVCESHRAFTKLNQDSAVGVTVRPRVSFPTSPPVPGRPTDPSWVLSHPWFSSCDSCAGLDWDALDSGAIITRKVYSLSMLPPQPHLQSVLPSSCHCRLDFNSSAVLQMVSSAGISLVINYCQHPHPGACPADLGFG